MPFVNAQQSRLFAGSLVYTGYTRSVSIDDQTMALEVTTLADSAESFIVGQTTSTMSLDLLMDAPLVAQATVWETTTPQPVTYLPNGLALTAECFLADALLTQFSTSSAVADVVTASITTQNTGPLGAGVVVATQAAITTTGNGTGVDNAVATTGGAVAHLHVSAFSGLTSDTITVQDSADNSSFATIGTFAVVSGVTYQRLNIAGTVRRYTRVVDTCVGVGSCTRIVALARL